MLPDMTHGSTTTGCSGNRLDLLSRTCSVSNKDLDADSEALLDQNAKVGRTSIDVYIGQVAEQHVAP